MRNWDLGVLSVLSLLGVTLWSPPVRAEPTADVTDETANAKETDSHTESYAGSIVLADGLSVVSAALGVGTFMEGEQGLGLALIFSGVGGYFFAAPAVHWAKVDFGRALASEGVRWGVPIGSGILGALVLNATSGRASSDTGDNYIGSAGAGFILGFAVGIPLAMATDAIFLAHRPVNAARHTSLLPLSFSVQPTYDPRSRTMGVGITGRL